MWAMIMDLSKWAASIPARKLDSAPTHRGRNDDQGSNTICGVNIYSPPLEIELSMGIFSQKQAKIKAQIMRVPGIESL